MRPFFEKILLPLYHLLSGRNIRPQLEKAQENQWLSREDLMVLQNQRLQKLLAHAYQNVPFYRRRFNQAGLHPDDIQRADDLTRLPPLTKDELRSSSDDLIATNYRRKKLVSRSTGGSTGVPISFYYDRVSWDSRVAAGYLAYHWAGWDFGMRRAILSGSAIEKAAFSSARGKLKSILFREIFLDTFEMSEQTRHYYLQRLQKFQPKLLYGYVSACTVLARQAIREQLSLSIPAIIVSAEMLFPDQRKLIEDAFGGRVFNLYGSREAAAIGMECPYHTGLHLAIDRLVVEILQGDKPAPADQSGEVVITDLLNYGMPFIRYKIGDIGKFIKAVCPCGRQLPLFELTHGRICDLIVTPEGKYLPGEFFPHLFKEVSSTVEKYQIIQESIDKLVVKIVPHSSYGPSQTEYLKSKIQSQLGPNVKVDFTFVENIAPEKSGKHRVTVSHLDEKDLSMSNTQSRS